MTSFKFISPSGDIVKGKNLKKFCNENKLGYWPMYRLLRGKHASINGWYAFHKRSKMRLQHEQQKLYNIVTGETAVLGKTHRQFANEKKLDQTLLGELLNGDRIAYRNWVTERTYRLIGGQELFDQKSTCSFH